MKTSPPHNSVSAEELLRVSLSIPDPYVRVLTLARIGRYLRKIDERSALEAFKYAVESVGEIEDPVLAIRSMIAIAHYLHSAGYHERAIDTLNQAYEAAKLIRGRAGERLLLEMAREALKLGLYGEAVVYSTRIENAQVRDEFLFEVVKESIKRGNLRLAKNILDQISDESARARAAFEVIKAHLEREEFASVLALLGKIDDPHWLRIALEEVAGKLENVSVPLETYYRFVEVARELSVRTGTNLLEAFLIGLVERGELDKVMEILNSTSTPERAQLALKLAKLIISSPGRLYSFVKSLRLPPEDFDLVAKSLLDGLLEIGAKEDFEELVEYIGRNTEDEAVLVKAATYLAKLGKFDAAEKLAEGVEDPRLRSLAFGAIAVEKLRKGDIDGAIEASTRVSDGRWSSWLMGEILVKLVELMTGEDSERGLEESASIVDTKSERGER